MNNFPNNGLVFIKSGMTTKLVKFQFKSDRITFRINKNKVNVNPDGVNLYCKLYKSEKESTAFCKDYGEVMELLLDVEMKNEVVTGQFTIKDIPFVVSMFAEGFLFNFDLGKVNQAYAIVIKDRSIFVSVGNKNVFNKKNEPEPAEACDDFCRALSWIYSHARDSLKEITSKPQHLH